MWSALGNQHYDIQHVCRGTIVNLLKTRFSLAHILIMKISSGQRVILEEEAHGTLHSLSPSPFLTLILACD